MYTGPTGDANADAAGRPEQTHHCCHARPIGVCTSTPPLHADQRSNDPARPWASSPNGAGRFFERYCETWRRSVLNLRGRKKWWRWMAQARPAHWAFTLRALGRTQRLMEPSHYLREYRLSEATGDLE